MAVTIGIAMASGDDMVHLLGHDRLLVAALHGKLMDELVGEQEALFIELSIEDSPTVHTRLKG